jgi:hypothetical protein
VDKARKQLADLNATEIALTAKLIERRNLLLSMPQDSPPTREITRKLAIINKRAQTLASQVFAAELALEQAIDAEETAALNAATDANATAADTSATSKPVAEKGPLKLYAFKITANENTGTRFVVGEVGNSGTKDVENVTVVFNLLDDGGDLVGTVSDNTDRIKAGAKWSFKALVPDDAAVRVEFMEIQSGAPSGLPALPGTEPAPKPVPPPATPPAVPPTTPPFP